MHKHIGGWLSRRSTVNLAYHSVVICLGPLFIDFMTWRVVVNAEVIGNVTPLWWVTKLKQHGKFSYGIVLLHENAYPHTANAIQKLLRKSKWDVFCHSSPHLWPELFILWFQCSWTRKFWDKFSPVEQLQDFNANTLSAWDNNYDKYFSSKIIFFCSRTIGLLFIGHP